MSVTRQALEHIQRMIIEGELKPGDRLPPEHELADQLGVSRGSLREAVGALSHANILDVRRGDGTFVTSLEPDELMSGVVFALELVQARDMDEVLEVRRLLFPQAAALAAQRVTRGQLDEMHAIVDELETADLAHRHRRPAPPFRRADRRSDRKCLAGVDSPGTAHSERPRPTGVVELGPHVSCRCARPPACVRRSLRTRGRRNRTLDRAAADRSPEALDRRSPQSAGRRPRGRAKAVRHRSMPRPLGAYPTSPMAKLTTAEVDDTTQRVL